MSVSWKNFVDAFRIGSDTGNVESLAKMITNDFNWITSGMNREETLSWTCSTSFRINGAPETFYENGEVIDRNSSSFR